MKIKPFSSIQKVNKTVQIALPAAYASNEIFGVNEVLESWKRQYVQQLQGVVVNFKRVTVQPQAFIPVGQPAVHVSVTATFYLFCPKRGDIIKGRINRISREHVGCLVQGTINVTIHLTDDTSSDLLRFLYLDKEILFEITSFFFHRRVIRVDGKVTLECIELMQAMYPEDEEVSSESAPSRCRINPASSPHSNSYVTNDYASLGDDVSTEDLLRIFKAEKLSEEEMDIAGPTPVESALLAPREAQSQLELPSTECDSSPESKQKKKRRRVKIKTEEPTDLDTSHTETESQSKKRKRKKSIASEDLPEKKLKMDGGEYSIMSDDAIINSLLSESSAESNSKSRGKEKLKSKLKNKNSSLVVGEGSPKKIKKEKHNLLNLTNNVFENSITSEEDNKHSKKSEKIRKKDKKKGSKKKVKDKDELKALKRKKKHIASGTVLKKDKVKKKSKKDKSSDKSKKGKNKDKKSKSKKRDKIKSKTE